MKTLAYLALLILAGCSTGPSVFMNPITRQVVNCDAEGHRRMSETGTRDEFTRAYALAAGRAECAYFAKQANYIPLN